MVASRGLKPAGRTMLPRTLWSSPTVTSLLLAGVLVSVPRAVAPPTTICSTAAIGLTDDAAPARPRVSTMS